MNRSYFEESITKVLSANDIGTTKSHQAGILIPKSIIGFNYFPLLNQKILNPREIIEFTDIGSGKSYKFNYIFYNNKMISNGTRMEYRLTGIRPYLFDMKAELGDELVFGYSGASKIPAVTLKKFANKPKKVSSELSTIALGSAVIKLQSGWKVVGS
jgi:hypothetical protein